MFQAHGHAKPMNMKRDRNKEDNNKVILVCSIFYVKIKPNTCISGKTAQKLDPVASLENSNFSEVSYLQGFM